VVPSRGGKKAGTKNGCGGVGRAETLPQELEKTGGGRRQLKRFGPKSKKKKKKTANYLEAGLQQQR